MRCMCIVFHHGFQMLAGIPTARDRDAEVTDAIFIDCPQSPSKTANELPSHMPIMRTDASPFPFRGLAIGQFIPSAHLRRETMYLSVNIDGDHCTNVEDTQVRPRTDAKMTNQSIFPRRNRAGRAKPQGSQFAR